MFCDEGPPRAEEGLSPPFTCYSALFRCLKPTFEISRGPFPHTPSLFNLSFLLVPGTDLKKGIFSDQSEGRDKRGLGISVLGDRESSGGI